MSNEDVEDAILGEIEKRVRASPMLDDQERRETIERARKHVNQQRKNAAIDTLFEQAVREAEREHAPDQQLVDITIDLPQYAPFIRLDNIVYFHGCTYEVVHSVAMSMQDVMARAWEHQSEIEGRKRRGDQLLTPRNSHVGNLDVNRGANRISDLNNFQQV